MVLWFVGGAVVAVWLVFRDPALDHRLVAAGAVLPLADNGSSSFHLAHTLVFSVVLLTGVMVATRGRRSWRRRLLAVPIGTFLHLVLDGAWTSSTTFWWPLLGADMPDGRVGPFDRPLAAVALMELAGLVAIAWFGRRFRLFEPARRRTFVRTGRLDRSLAGPPPIR